MSNLYNLSYAIAKRIPPTPKTLKAILDAQSLLNQRVTWLSPERLALAPVNVEPARSSLAFPLIRLAPRPQPQSSPNFLATIPVNRIPDAAAYGTTKARDLWTAHLVAAFLQLMSERYPDLVFELQDEGGFVVPGAILIQAGKVQANRYWLNRERERVLEITGDPEAGVPYLLAEADALQGRFFQEAAVSDFAEVPEIAELDQDWEELESVGLSDVAKLVVKHALAPVASAA